MNECQLIELITILQSIKKLSLMIPFIHSFIHFLNHLILKKGAGAYPSYHQVWPNLYIGDESMARDKATLSSLGVTHIVNAAAGRHRIHTGPQFYNDLEVEYLAVEAADHPEFNLRPYFSSSANFIENALNNNGKVFVHCAMGVSRSGTLVLAYLMICQGLSLAEAIIAVRLNRDIGPNSGFLEQLRQLDLSLSSQGRQITSENNGDKLQQ
uniref:Dual specificity protein phosphatase n=1 Tax=Sphaeramia orbicularis TaxID=375764 RepID=A0A673B3S1_9TELE